MKSPNLVSVRKPYTIISTRAFRVHSVMAKSRKSALSKGRAYFGGPVRILK